MAHNDWLVAYVQVYMMDKRYFDPRRPLGTPTKDDQAEMLVPYDVELPFAPQFFATHEEQVANLKGDFASTIHTRQSRQVF